MSFRAKSISHRTPKSSNTEFTIVTVAPKGGTSDNSALRLLKANQEHEKNSWKGISIETVGRPGQGLHTQRGTSTKFLKLFEAACRQKLDKLKKEEDYRPSLILFMPVSEQQLVKNSLPQNSYCKGNFLQPHELLYRIYKTDAKLVRSIFEASGFNYTDSHDWNIMWIGSSAKPYLYEGLNEYQRINHFPNSFELTRKDRMCANIVAMQKKFGKQAFDFIPDTFILPDEYSDFYNQFYRDKTAQWILKPSASSRGRGIYLIENVEDVPTDEPCIVSQYIQNPLLINGLKFDIRLYVLITSIDPLKIYIYEEGLARFASEPYTPGNKNNHFIHLTNYSVNKNNDKFVQNNDWRQDDVGHKWSLHALMKHLESVGIDTDLMWNRIYELVVKAILSVEEILIDNARKLGLHRNNCFDLFGFDVLLDSNLKPWLLEVNLSPSLATDAPLDLHIKGNLIADAFNLIGVRVYDRKKENPSKIRARIRFRQSQYSNKFRGVSSQPARAQSPSMKRKDTNSRSKLKDVIKEAIEEYDRRGGFLRIYPAKDCDYYDQYFSTIRPINKALYNALFNDSADLHSSSSVKNFTRPQTTSLLKRDIKINTCVDQSNPPANDNRNQDANEQSSNKKIKVDSFSCIQCKSQGSSEIPCTHKQPQTDKIVVTGDDVLICYVSRVIDLIKTIPEERLRKEWKKSIDKFICHHAWENPEAHKAGTLLQKLEVRLSEMKEMKRKKVYSASSQPDSENDMLEEVRNQTIGKCSIIQLEEMLKSSSNTIAQDIVSCIVGRERGLLSDIISTLQTIKTQDQSQGYYAEAESDGESFSKCIEKFSNFNPLSSKLAVKGFSSIHWRSSIPYMRPHTTSKFR
ncbi:unnamed protein product [Blepharisma stoltei]|uniref:Tubulin--tyrosine ligase-like protein 5 n=1 Tax=Blepharisma stoltei TaxID=1481888 RepID=A0AAU9IXB5_9CILI|nr:unnamed protein product [Blepharisma stoltei]